MSPARVAGRVSRVVSGETVTHAMERTPSSVALTAEALRLLDDPRDETRETKMSMLEHDMWNPFRTDQMDALDDARDRMSVHEEDDAAGGKRQSRVSGNSAFDAVGGSFVAYLAPRFGPSSSSRPAKLLMRTLAQELDCAASRDVGSRGSVALESSGVQLHDRDDVAVLFVGELENKAELAENLPDRTPRTASPAPSSSTASTRTPAPPSSRNSSGSSPSSWSTLTPPSCSPPSTATRRFRSSRADAPAAASSSRTPRDPTAPGHCAIT